MKFKWDKSKLSCIKEVYYACGTHPELDILLLDYYHPLDNFWRDSNYAWLVYLDLNGKKQLICNSLFNTDESKKIPKVKFVKRLLSLTDININTLLYVCTFYQQTSNKLISSKIFSDYKHQNDILKSFTTYSHGRIVYRHQAAFLYGLSTGCTGDEALQWVTDMCFKKEKAIKEAKKILFEETTSLYTLWKSRTLDRVVRRANWDGTKILLNHLSLK